MFSGGLDSTLAAKILEEQGIEVVCVNFKSYFFDEKLALQMAKKYKLNLRVIDFSEEHLEVVKHPKYGYGKAMNPCIDCHILMLKKLKEIMKKENFDFVASGEVLGERPMSQTKRALKIVEEESSLKGYLLRPLSAKLLEETIPEKKKIVEREKLFGIKGRSRKKQIELAKKFGIEEYPTPAGGCLLTDLEFGKKLKELFQVFPECDGNDIQLLKNGRQFWFGKLKIVVGRNQEENQRLKDLARKGDVLIELENYPGPTTLIRNYGKSKIGTQAIEKAKELTKHFSTKAREKTDVKFLVMRKS
jgi:tRNA U34 2-thiouridine synthase MnmA/TrmU